MFTDDWGQFWSCLSLALRVSKSLLDWALGNLLVSWTKPHERILYWSFLVSFKLSCPEVYFCALWQRMQVTIRLIIWVSSLIWDHPKKMAGGFSYASPIWKNLSKTKMEPALPSIKCLLFIMLNPRLWTDPWLLIDLFLLVLGFFSRTCCVVWIFSSACIIKPEIWKEFWAVSLTGFRTSLSWVACCFIQSADSIQSQSHFASIFISKLNVSRFKRNSTIWRCQWPKCPFSLGSPIEGSHSLFQPAWGHQSPPNNNFSSSKWVPKNIKVVQTPFPAKLLRNIQSSCSFEGKHDPLMMILPHKGLHFSLHSC